MTDLEFRDLPSAYSTSGIISFALGAPYNSILKSIFTHTAEDLIEQQNPFESPNPDTGVQTSYYEGPDYATGYGMLNIRCAINLMTFSANAQPEETYHITEDALEHGDYHQYTLHINRDLITNQKGFKATLVWDDYTAGDTSDLSVPKLVNNLGLFIKDPQGNIHYPWSVDLPYDIHSPWQPSPTDVEPDPITDSDIVLTRRDQPNDRDNIEQVVIEGIGANGEGEWGIYVVDNGMTAPGPQRCSLVFSP